MVTTVLCAFIDNIFLLSLMGIGILALLFISRTFKKVATFIGLFLVFWVVAIIITFLITGDLLYSIGYFSPFFARFFIIISAGLLFAFTTPPQKLAQSLQKMKIPPSIIFTLIITLRYIPTLAREASAIINALKLRGIKITPWELIKKPSYFYRGLIIPLIIRTIKISDEIAIAAESRGFRPSNNRNCLYEVVWNKNDYIFTFTAILALLMILILDKSSLLLVYI